jgi:CubicO group peptidase (beta-lactamase class C family)
VTRPAASSRRRLLQGGLATAAVAAGRYALGTLPVAHAQTSDAPGGFRPGGLEAVDEIVAAAVSDRAFPGGVLAVGRDGTLVHLAAFGHLSYDPAAAVVATDTLYDLASLTKVVVTTTLSMILLDEGKLDLDARVHDYFPAFSGPAKERVTVRHLLTHSGGLQWWAPLYKEVKGKKAYLERIVAMDLAYEPGAKTVYSDLGIILLGDILERVSGIAFEDLARKRVLQPLAMKDAQYRPPAELLSRIAPTENDPWRGRVVRGEVHDENALALGGVAPHAGLFASASDLAHLAEMLLDGGSFGGRRIVSRAAVELFTARAGVPASSRALGWDTPTDESGHRSSTRGEPGFSSAGSLLSARSFGHTGFTGTSMWMDPERGLYVILLTNRVNPTRENNAIGQVRAQVADAVVRALERP